MQQIQSHAHQLWCSPVCQHHIQGKQIFGASAPLLAGRKDLLDGQPLAVQPVERLGGPS